MQDILRNHEEENRRSRAWAFAIGLSALIATIMFMGNDGEVDPDMILNLDPILILYLQGVFSLIVFVGIPVLFIKIALKIPFYEFFPSVSLRMAGITILATISFMVINSAVGEWNMNLDFGNSSFAEWARASEETLRVFTEHVTDFQSTHHFILALVVVGIIPGIGEELLFRGLIQNSFAKATGNYHIAIWLTGLIFAVIHLQFFGVAPRMLLGVLFGYLYHWSGKLSLAMIGHAVNNSLAVLGMYLIQQGAVEVPADQMEKAAPWPIILLFTAVFTWLILTFRKRSDNA